MMLSAGKRACITYVLVVIGRPREEDAPTSTTSPSRCFCSRLRLSGIFNDTQPPASPIPLPATFLTVQDILQLPLENFTVGIGDPFVPQAGFGKSRVAPLIHLFFQDTWHLRPRLVVDY